MAQTPKEAALQHTAELCVYVAERAHRELPPAIAGQADECYCKDVGQVEWLCETLRYLEAHDDAPITFEKLVYNGRHEMSRRLADWWEEHKAADEARERAEADTVRRAELRASVLAKLTEEEREAFARFIR
jgi:hypothetical protein